MNIYLMESESRHFIDAFFNLLEKHEEEPTSPHTRFLMHPYILIIGTNGHMDLVNNNTNTTVSHSRGLKRSDPKWIRCIGTMLSRYLCLLS